MKCLNSKCEVVFQQKNPKKLYCSLKCKNQAAYWNKQETYEWEIKLQKYRQKNILILEGLQKRRVSIINNTELLKIGFYFKAAILPDLNDIGQNVYRFGNIYLIQHNKTDFKIEKIKNEIKS